MLTDISVKNLPATGVTYEKCYGDGLSIRISPKGVRTFQFRYRFDKTPYRFSFGKYPLITCKEAKAMLWEVKKSLEQGCNPVEEKRRRREERRKAEIGQITVSQICEKWLTDYGRAKRKRCHDLELILEKDVYKQIGSIPIKNISRLDISENVLSPILQRSSPVQANKTLTLIKQILNFAVERGYIDFNPSALITKRSVGGTEKPRDRYLALDEISQFWVGLNDTDITEPITYALKILLTTGQRRGEISAAKWKDVNFNSSIWTIPETKNGKSHRVPLSSLSIELFMSLKKITGNAEWVLPGINEEQSLSEHAITRAARRNISKIGVSKWVPHDLRRTFTTQLNEAGVGPHIVEKLLNHKMVGILAVYNHAEYWEEQCKAVEIWGNILRSTIYSVKSCQ